MAQLLWRNKVKVKVKVGSLVQSLWRYENLATKEIFLVPGATIRRLIILRAGEVDDKTVRASLRGSLRANLRVILRGRFGC